jgi:phosphoribosylanthranilate isomerase
MMSALEVKLGQRLVGERPFWLSMRTRVKICGITRRGDAELAIELGASALGFNFYRESPRYVAPEAAREIIVRAVPPPVMAVGVFADETDAEHVLRVARESGVNAIQLHGPHFPGHDNGFRWTYPLIRAVTVDENFGPESLGREEGGAILLDAYHPVLKGGTGCTIDWGKARGATKYCRVILAGGLTPENVAEAIRQVRPFAVDVASGVESAPGIKDASKLREFFNAACEADRT